MHARVFNQIFPGCQMIARSDIAAKCNSQLPFLLTSEVAKEVQEPETGHVITFFPVRGQNQN